MSTRQAGVRTRALARAARQRALALRTAETGWVGPTVPAGWCVSTVTRLLHDAPDAVEQARELQRELARAGPFEHYPRPSLHLSLLGCTAREPVPPTEPRRLAGIRAAVRETLAGARPIPVELGGVNADGGRLFCDVLTDDPGWAALRLTLAERLSGLGERPICYPDPEPMRVNLGWFTEAPHAGRLRALLRRPAVLLPVTLRTVELVVTDFTATPQTLVVLDTLSLTG